MFIKKCIDCATPILNENAKLKQEIKQLREGNVELKIGKYTLSKHPINPELNNKSFWIMNDNNEGMEIDLDILWKEHF